ncbi:NapC/NirT family cytochrome c [Halodesulfovibrio marinisediminis]|uniref:Trimethylamine-N-oxide reductase (Cytochrome c), cytochrome c-type subunit TorC n=1 Tax=Halodesulfovibrio marinisediminis DSM 17456 TaxID=1121457 RepID=A0A1N6ECH5_9BACT|nr:NapC/NirT family cytochrome c [Halodesulfovibrio marinisediminis]SIN80742.1 trimethylamine-N-oxide reductase (cytochrome c), cytochrome c-type subunit TorC [Halodesulfovibrio marinisediminis DSM 17456]
MTHLFTTKRALLVIGLIVVTCISSAGVFATTNKESGGFCLSCHEMKENVFPAYSKSKHYMSASGVRADCSSCHVPSDFLPMLQRKIVASRELVQSFKGVLDTPEKFDENRLRLAKRVWAEMEANDSRECRECHEQKAFKYDSFKKQDGAKRMQKGLSEGQTCINCHKGITHKLPDMSSGYKLAFEELITLAKEQGISGDIQYPILMMPIYKEKDGKPVGRLLPATQVKVLERADGWLNVLIEGWQQDGVDAMIYEEQGKRIFSAALSKKIRSDVKVHGTQVDPDTEQTWHQVSLTCWIKSENVINSREPLWSYGSEMLSSACSTCHNATPAAHFNANQWIGNLKAMKHNISLSKQEYRFFLKYLQMHASDMNGSH